MSKAKNHNQDILKASTHYDEFEQSLDNLDPAWAKSSLYFRSLGNWHFGHSNEIRCQSLIAIHEQLQVRKKRYEEGESVELLYAIKLCVQENLPIPSWVALAFQSKMDEFGGVAGDNSLDNIFSSSYFPKSPKRAADVRLDWQVGVEIWKRVWEISADHSSIDSAMKAVLKSKNYGLGLTKAREIVLEIDRNQFELLGKPKSSLEHFFNKKKKV